MTALPARINKSKTVPKKALPPRPKGWRLLHDAGFFDGGDHGGKGSLKAGDVGGDKEVLEVGSTGAQPLRTMGSLSTAAPNATTYPRA